MRKGYWRTLTRQLRDKVAAGECSFVSPDGTMTIAMVEADADADLEHSAEVLLAHDACGHALILDTASSAVFQQHEDGVKHILAPDLMSFVSALFASGPPSLISGDLTLGDAVGEPPNFPIPRRSILDD